MDDNSRLDIIEYRRLSSVIKFPAMPFERVMALIVNFLIEALPGLRSKYQLRISTEVFSAIQDSLNVADLVARRELPDTVLIKSRVALWKIYDNQAAGSDARNLARVVVCALYDEESAEFSTYGAEAMFETFFSSLLELNPDCCTVFADYVLAKKSGQNTKQ